jgi:hypothetical protein
VSNSFRAGGDRAESFINASSSESSDQNVFMEEQYYPKPLILNDQKMLHQKIKTGLEYATFHSAK